MKSNYKRIGDYIERLSNKNNDLSVTDLKGINIDKEFMPSVANTTGTDMSKYKVVQQYQFAFNPMHVGRDEVLPISMLERTAPVIVSPAYTVFKVEDHDQLDPEYLMMWFRRPEFDRNAWFTTDSSVRGGFSWDDFCDMTLPVPHIDTQREIVREYNIVVDRILLNEELIQKLEEAAQTLYKHWFVDFEFPISKKYADSTDKTVLEGMPYQSSGGEMVYCDDLDKEIPIDWAATTLSSLINVKHGYAFKGEYFTDDEDKYVLLSPGNFKIGGGFKPDGIRYYTGEVPSEYIFKPGDLMVTMTDLSKQSDTLGYPAIIPNLKQKKLLHNQRLGKVEFVSDFDYQYLLFGVMCSFDYRTYIVGGATGTTVKHTSPTRIMDFSLALPVDRTLCNEFDHISRIIHEYIECLLLEILELDKFRKLLRSKIGGKKS